jgi:hypothetical protein
MTLSNHCAILLSPILLVSLLGCESTTGQGRADESTAPRLNEEPQTTRGSGGRASMTVDLTSLPQHVTLAVGERKVISLPSYANSGNTWSATCVRGHGIAQLSVELGESPVAGDSGGSGIAAPPPLTLTPEYAVVLGLAGGEAVCQLVLSRTFGPGQVAASHELRITVVAVREQSR